VLTSKRMRLAILVLVLLAGIALGRTWSYDVYVYWFVVSIKGSSEAGCEGEIGAGPVYFRVVPGYTGDGAYSLKCGERLVLGREVQLACQCDAR
jgi:hypothetical protein